jgi:hypothetical protein
MNWIELLGAVGIGAIVIKILDVVWLQQVMRESERRKWLRESRLKAYSVLGQQLLAHGPWSGPEEPTELFFVAAEAMLLADDEQMAQEIKDFLRSVMALRQKLEELDFELSEAQCEEEEEALRDKRWDVTNQGDGKAKADALVLISRLRSSIMNR